MCLNCDPAVLHLNYDSAVLLLSIYPKEMSVQKHQRSVRKCFMESLFIKAKNLETTQMPINRGMDKHTVVKSDPGILYID